MTADPARRRRASRIGLFGLVGAVIAIVVMSVVAVTTLRSSEEGTEVRADVRPAQRFPSTPMALVGVADGERLTSLVVFVVDPSGRGGSVVTVPVNIDTSSGFGAERTPLSRRAITDAEPLLEELAPMLGIAPSFAEIVDAEGLRALLGDVEQVAIRLEDPVVDAADGEVVTVLEPGERLVDVDTAVEVLTAVSPPDEPAYDHHPGDVAAWSGVAEAWSASGEQLDLVRDEVGVPEEPATFDELMIRLRAGSVAVRDLAPDLAGAITLDNPTDADFMLVDSRDTVLVFASIAPERVLAPNPTLTFSIVAPFSRAQVATVGEGITTSALIRDLIGELLFIEANVVAVDTQPAEEGAATETVVLLDDESFGSEGFLEALIGPSTSRLAARDTDGSDVVLVLGTDFLDHRAAMRAAREAERIGDDGGADFEVSGDEAPGDEGTVDADE